MTHTKTASHRVFRRFAAMREGVAAVEFALIGPVFILIVIGTIDLGQAFYTKLRIMNASTAAAHFAIAKGQNLAAADLSAFLVNVKSVVVSAAAFSSQPTVTVLFNNSTSASAVAQFYCLSGYPAVWVGAGSASSSCGANVLGGKYVTIRVEAQSASFFPSNTMLSTAFNLKDEVIVRVQ